MNLGIVIFLCLLFSLTCKTAPPDLATLSSIQKSCAPKPDAPIDALMKIGDMTIIPRDMFNRYSSRSLGAAIVYRMHERYEKGLEPLRWEETGFDWNNSDIILLFPEKYLSSVIERGILNQHQVGSSSASYQPERRLINVERMAGVRFEEKLDLSLNSIIHEVRPKFGMLNLYQERDLGERADKGDDYGELGALIKTSVKKARSTWSYQDSLTFTHKVTDSNEIPNYNYRRSSLGTFMYSHFQKYFYPGYPGKNSSYFEAQVWGRLTFEDIDQILIPDPSAKDMPQLSDSNKVKAMLAEVGMPVSTFKRVQKHNRYIWEKGEKVADGNPEKRQQTEAKQEQSYDCK